MKKKLLALILALAMVLSLTACGDPVRRPLRQLRRFSESRSL